jgi:hypothetical protein
MTQRIGPVTQQRAEQVIRDLEKQRQKTSMNELE